MSYRFSTYRAGFSYKNKNGVCIITMDPRATDQSGKSLEDIKTILNKVHEVGGTHADGTDIAPKLIKVQIPAISGALYEDGVKRGEKNRLGMGLLILDVDNKHEDYLDFATATKLLTEKDITHFAYTSYSSTEERQRFRLLFPLAEPTTTDLWPNFVEYVLEVTGLLPYRECMDLSCLHAAEQIYFLPGKLKGTDPVIHRASHAGKDLEVPADGFLENIPVPKNSEAETNALAEINAGNTEWAKAYSINFNTLDLKGLLEDNDVMVMDGSPAYGGIKYRCFCPWGDEHTSTNTDDAFIVVEREEGKWPLFHCSHECHKQTHKLKEVLELYADQLEDYAEEFVPDPSKSRQFCAEDEDEENFTKAGMKLPGLYPGDKAQLKKWEERRAEIKSRDCNSRILMWTQPQGKTPPRISTNIINFNRILANDPAFVIPEGCVDTNVGLRFNSMTMAPTLHGVPLEEGHLSAICDMIARVYGVAFDHNKIGPSVSAQACKHKFSKVFDYIEALPEWDGNDHIGDCLEKILKIPRSDANFHLQHEYLLRWMSGGVLRQYDPGAKVDAVLILAGVQDVGKSSLLEILGGDFHIPLPPQSRFERDDRMKYHRGWIIEIPEIDGMMRGQVQQALKAEFSTNVDYFRIPWGRIVQEFFRRFIFSGTTNEPETLLHDRTGNRRYWVIDLQHLRAVDIDKALLRSMRDQMWAQAKANYLVHGKDCCWLREDDLREMSRRYTEAFLAPSPIEEKVLNRGMEIIALAKSAPQGGLPITVILETAGFKTTELKSLVNQAGPVIKRLGWVQKRHGKARIWYPTAKAEETAEDWYSATGGVVAPVQENVRGEFRLY